MMPSASGSSSPVAVDTQACENMAVPARLPPPPDVVKPISLVPPPTLTVAVDRSTQADPSVE